ncbi:MAG: hypothetical protein J6K17_10345 [Oscillospiraceae bacterium]|nr:hypothetical protein [Oscillospiraceae bacterium]
MKKKLNVVNLITCIAFFGILIAFPIITIFAPKESFSDIENRTLQSMPEASAKTIYDRSYMNKLETYISDHFAGRTDWIKMKTAVETFAGKYERNGIYILDDRLVEKVEEPDYAFIDKSINAINKFVSDNDVPVYFMLVPTSAEIYRDQLPESAPNANQRELINYVYGALSKNASTIDVYPAMQAEKFNYIYYRTDHHWTTQGAYIAYQTAGKKMGYEPVPREMYDIEHASDSFLGTFYSKALYGGIEKDSIDIYHYNGGSSVKDVLITSEYGKDPASYDSMYFREFLDVKDKYSTFLGTNQPLVTIKTDSEGGKLLMFKDSYAHCYVPFLTQHYSEITLVDMRYIQMSYKGLLNPEDYDQVMFLYNASSFMTDINLRKLAYGS